MLVTLLLGSALAAHPVQGLAGEHPGGRWLSSADGRRLLHASGFLEETGAPGPGQAALAFLQRHGAAFGLGGRQALALRPGEAAGPVSAVRLRRTLDGRPVFGGDLVVGVDGENRVFLVNAGDAPAAASGRFAVGPEAAWSAAQAWLRPGERAVGQPVVEAGWRVLGSELRAVYQVDLATSGPGGEWRVVVDGESGRVLLRQDLRRYDTGRVYEISPMETLAAQCPLGASGAHTACAAAPSRTLAHLASGTRLTGSQAAAYNCAGNDPPAAAGATAPCAQTASPTSGAYDYPPDVTSQSSSDEFAAVMVYYHLDKHYSFLRLLDPGLDLGSLPAFVNAFDQGQPYDNAFYSPLLKAMVFGQGRSTDYAYDASVAYHELDHGAVDAWSLGGFESAVDSLGGLDEPAAVNEGTADALAVAETGRSQIGLYVAGTRAPPSPYLRELDNLKTCKGDGTLTAGGNVKGLDGEVHDDGEIWGGFYWELQQGLARVSGCGGLCGAAAAIQAKAVQLAGPLPTLRSYGQTMVAAAQALYPSRPEVPSYVQCVASRRALTSCDRTFPLYAGEKKALFIRLRYSTFQAALEATAATAFGVCSGRGTAASVYLRRGKPVEITSLSGSGATTGTWDGGPIPIAVQCSSGATSVPISSAGTWYVLVDAPGAFPPIGEETFLIQAQRSGMAARPPAAPPPNCVLGASGSDGGGPAGGGGAPSAGGMVTGGCGYPSAGWSAAALVLLVGWWRRRAVTASGGEGAG
jgi:hypothetical protein